MRRRKTRVLTGAVILTLGFIWGNSLLPASASGALSGWIAELMGRMFGGLMQSEAGHGVLRKLAHGTEYLVLGVELTLLLKDLHPHPWSLVSFLGVSTALVDETIQLFSAGRCGQIQDIWIDLGGFAAGALGCVLTGMLRNKRSRKT